MPLLFRQLFDVQSSTYSYLLADSATREAVLIDPVFEQVRREIALIRELGLCLLYTVETHVHADHVTGAWLLREALGSRIVLGARGGATGADLELRHGDRLRFGSRGLEARATPGHTNGCMSYVLDDRSMVFTGDALLIRGCGRTDFQEGDARTLYRSVHEQILSLPDDCLVYPGHDYLGSTASSVGEERRFNPRLGAEVREEDFVGYMANLGLAHPRLMDKAVPANKLCGMPETAPSAAARDWAPLRYTYAGINEVDPHWVEEHKTGLLLLDVREPGEFTGGLGHIADSRLVPLGDLAKRLESLPRDRPVVTVCRSGARSARAAQMLEQAGFPRVANLAGGLLRWRAQGLPVEAGGE